MNWKSTIAVGALALATSITGPALLSPASAASTSTTAAASHDASSLAKAAKHKHHKKKHHKKKKHHVKAVHHSCTTTSSGSCIRGGEFCPQSKYGQGGYDSKGRHYTCEGDHTHPHWMK